MKIDFEIVEKPQKLKDLEFEVVEKPVENSASTPVDDVRPRYLDEMPDFIENPGSELFSPAKRLGEYLRAEMQRDKRLYLFSPDETTSNKLDAVYAEQQRAWVLPTRAWDMPESANGRVVELLSENTLFAAMVGHVLGSREQAFMTSYESFFEIIASQLLQHLKFLKQVDETEWRVSEAFDSAMLAHEAVNEEKRRGGDALRGPAARSRVATRVDGDTKRQDPRWFPAINLLSTSTCWRQDHNGFSHQSPALISTLLDVPTNKVNCLFPVDDVATTAAFDFMLNSHNVVNLTTFNKTDEPRFIDRNHARFQLENGGTSIFGFASNCGENENPDLIITSAGDIVSREALAAVKILREDLPGLKVRFVGIAALTHGAIGTTEKPLPQATFDAYFGQSAPIIANFHGYAHTLKTILGNYTDARRVHAHGFSEQGSTTTPLEMLTLNHASRFDLAADAAATFNRPDLAEKYRQVVRDNHEYALQKGEDMIQLYGWK